MQSPTSIGPRGLSAPKIKNMTDLAQLTKLNAQSPLPAKINAVQVKLDQYAADLNRDPTKTSTQKAKLLHEAAIKMGDALLPSIDQEGLKLREKIRGFNDKINPTMTIKGTTDMLLLNDMARAIDGMPATEIRKLTLGGEPDAVRAVLLLPSERFKRGLDSKTTRFLKDSLVEVTLGDDYKTYQALNAQHDHLHTLGSRLLDSVNASRAEAQNIDTNQAVAPELDT